MRARPLSHGRQSVDPSPAPADLRDQRHLVAGVDGCRGGWMLAVLGPDRLQVRRIERFAAVVEQVDAHQLEAVAVDMPIGLSDGPARRADQEARRRLGPRRSSVFPTPVRAALDAVDYPDALAISRRVSGKGMSKQSYNLLAAMAEVDRVMSPARQARIVESHPELAFAQLAGRPLLHAKRTPDGIAERVALLACALGPGPTADLVAALADRPPGSGADDVVDATVIAWVAAGLALGDPRVEHLGDGARDRRGLRMEIVTRSAPECREVPCND